jgi:hypothetical protein
MSSDAASKSANGWRIAEDPPVRFRRSASIQAASAPSAGRIN